MLTKLSVPTPSLIKKYLRIQCKNRPHLKQNNKQNKEIRKFYKHPDYQKGLKLLENLINSLKDNLPKTFRNIKDSDLLILLNTVKIVYGDFKKEIRKSTQIDFNITNFSGSEI